MNRKNSYNVPAVDRTLDILDYLGKNPQANLTQIYQDLDLAKSTTYGILLTLEARGFIRKDAAGGYQLGLKLYELGSKAVGQIDFVKEALPVMKELTQKTGLTCNLGVLEGDVGVYLEKVDAPSPIRLNSWKGKRIPLHCTSLGKVLLAYRSQSEIQEIVDRIKLVPHTEKTITDKRKLLEELTRIKEVGFAMDNEEHEPQITCMAAPVFNHTGKAVAAFSLSGLTSWVSEKKVEEISRQLKEACQELSQRIGG